MWTRSIRSMAAVTQILAHSAANEVYKTRFGVGKLLGLAGELGSVSAPDPASAQSWVSIGRCSIKRK